MYVPPHFAVHERKEITDFCVAHPFALLVTHGPEGLFATHLPVIFKAEEGAEGSFFGHIARPNPHWQRADLASEALLVFSGAHAYVTPSWYPTKRETAKVVPTWNYSVVHARGRLSWPDDEAFLTRNLADLTDAHEARFPHPWAMHDAPQDFLNKQMRAIVGMRFEVTRFDAKRKLSQNRPAVDVDGVVAGYSASDDPMEVAVGLEVAAHRRK
ncbi:MAG: FMN-binding negative transcriptional regulator [Alphaproteobacteria bacterium]